MPWIRRSHHVLGIEHLLSELRNTDSTVLLTTTSSQGGETDQEEMKTGKGDWVKQTSKPN